MDQEEQGEFIQLKWNTFQYCFLENLSHLRDKQVFTDVTLSCGDQFYPAHRLVLSSCSTFFARSLEVANCRSPVLLLHGLEQSTLEQLLMYMYDGQVTVTRESLPSLLKAAHWLGVKGLESFFGRFEPLVEGGGGGSPEQPGLSAQMWKQFLPLASEIKATGNGESSSVLQQIENRMDKNLLVSHVPSLSGPSDFRDTTDVSSTSERSNSQHSDRQGVPLLRPASELQFKVDSDSPSGSEKNFEGWDSNSGGKETSSVWGETKVKAENPDTVRGGKRSLRCKQCKKSFTVRAELARHLRMLHGSSRKFCSICNIEFLTVKSQNLHMKLHNSKSIHSCGKCDFISHKKKVLQEHCLSHNDEDAVSGKKMLLEKDGHVLHQGVQVVLDVSPQDESEKVMSDPGKKFCSSCKLEFFNVLAYNWHMKLHDSKSLHKCSKCEFISISQKSLSKHLQLHEGTKPTPEQKGQDVSQGKSVLKEAVENNTQEATQVPSLEKLNKDVVVPKLPRGITLVKCPTCSKLLRNKKVLLNHQQYCPDKTHKFMGSSNPAVKRRPQILKGCSRDLAKSKWFACGHCHFRGIRKKQLLNHVRKCHSDKE